MNDWADVDPLLSELRRRHWTIHLYGDPTEPELFVAVHRWDNRPCADVVILHGHDRAIGYRATISESADVFAPPAVHWWWAQSNDPSAAQWVLRRVLALDPPADTDTLQSAPTFCRLPADAGWPAVIRPT